MRHRYPFSGPDRQESAAAFGRGPARCGRVAGMVLLVLAASQGLPAPCRAGLVIQALNSSTLPGASGSFDVVLINSPDGTLTNVAANSLDISVSGPAAITITDVTMSTAATYI